MDLDAPIIAEPNFIGRAFARICNEISTDAEDWGQAVYRLHKFQDEKLLDQPTPENLETHRNSIEILIAFGEFISKATGQPAFPNRHTHEMVQATLQILRDDLALWHGEPLSPEKETEILTACFPA